MAQVFQLLGIRAHSKECRLLGVEGRGQSIQSQGEKKEKKDIRTCTKSQFACHVVCVQSMCRQAVCRGGLRQVQHGKIC